MLSSRKTQAAAVLSGALLLNVATAWAIVILTPLDPTPAGTVPPGEQATWRRHVPAEFPPQATSYVDKRFPGFRARVFLHDRIGEVGTEMRVYEVGFPLASMTGVKWQVGQGRFPAHVRFRGAIDPALVPVVPDVRVLPLVPVWPGILVNTIFNATVLVSVWIAARQLRRRFRRAGGRCPGCGYILAGRVAGRVAARSVCSECGEVLTESGWTAPPGV